MERILTGEIEWPIQEGKVSLNQAVAPQRQNTEAVASSIVLAAYLGFNGREKLRQQMKGSIYSDSTKNNKIV